MSVNGKAPQKANVNSATNPLKLSTAKVQSKTSDLNAIELAELTIAKASQSSKITRENIRNAREAELKRLKASMDKIHAKRREDEQLVKIVESSNNEFDTLITHFLSLAAGAILGVLAISAVNNH